MKKYEVVLLTQQFETYEVEANSNEEAISEALGGNISPKIEPCDSQVMSIEEINKK